MPRSINPENRPDDFRATHAVNSPNEVQADVLAAVSAAHSKLTSLDLQRRVSNRFGHNRRQIRAAIHRLITDGELNYIYESGRSLIERSFNRPVQITKGIVLCPSGRSTAVDVSGAVVIIGTGAAFGDGRHPSTRLALAGIEMVKDELINSQDAARGEVLDIGTGSGVLVLAAVQLGFGRGIGVDIDPCALSEAARNVALNQLADRIVIADRSLDSFDRHFNLICANLRWPTLKCLRDQIKATLVRGGAVVTAGIKTAEKKALIDWYGQAGFRCQWDRCRQDWAAVVFQQGT